MIPNDEPMTSEFDLQHSRSFSIFQPIFKIRGVMSKYNLSAFVKHHSPQKRPLTLAIFELLNLPKEIDCINLSNQPKQKQIKNIIHAWSMRQVGPDLAQHLETLLQQHMDEVIEMHQAVVKHRQPWFGEAGEGWRVWGNRPRWWRLDKKWEQLEIWTKCRTNFV